MSRAPGSVSGRTTSTAGRLFDEPALRLFVPWAWLHGYRFATAVTPEALVDATRVKEVTYGAAGYKLPPDFPELARKYDRAARVFVAYHRGQAVGTLSLLDTSVASPILDLVPVRLSEEVDPAHIWEIGRLAVEPSSRGRSHLVLIGLLRSMVLFSRQQGIRHWVAGSSRTVFRLARHFNASATLLPPDTSRAPEPDALRYWSSFLEAHRSTLWSTPCPWPVSVPGASSSST